MGVLGLTRFMRLEKNNVMNDFQLHDTRLVIDGDNIVFLLWEHFEVPQQCGGDYDEYAWKCRVFIDILRTCKVKPYVVFDGGSSLDGRKIDTILDRKQQRIQKVEEMCETGKGFVVPILAKKTFKNVLAEMSVPRVTCEFEADREMAVLANRFECPVMSFDSDFFVFDLKVGFIPFNYVQLATEVDVSGKNAFKYIPVKLFTRKSFAERYNITPNILPVLACILGNDYVDAEQLKEFYFQSNLSFYEQDPKKFTERMHDILKWLKKQDDTETCLRNVLQYTAESDREQFKNVLQGTIDEYRNLQTFDGLDLERFFARGLDCVQGIEMLYSRTDATPSLLPSWFRIAKMHCNITSHLQDVALLGIVYKDCQVEVLSERSTYGCSRSLREIIYAIILGQGSKMAVEEYDREEKEVKCFKVKPCKHVPGVSTFPTLETVPYRKREEMFSLLLASLQVPTELLKNTMSDFSKYLVGLVTYWIRNSKPVVNETHCYSVLIGIILLHVRLFKYNTPLAFSCSPEDFLDALTNTSNAQLNRIFEKTKHYFKCPQEPKKKNYVIHGFAQFQVCLKESLQLNQVVMMPLDPPSPSMVLNSSFLYNFYLDLRRKKDKKRRFLSEILEAGSPVEALFRNLLKSVKKVVDG